MRGGSGSRSGGFKTLKSTPNLVEVKVVGVVEQKPEGSLYIHSVYINTIPKAFKRTPISSTTPTFGAFGVV